MVYGRLDDRLEEYPRNDSPECINGSCVSFCFFGHCGGIMGSAKRAEVREKFMIKGSAFNDWLVSVVFDVLRCCCMAG